MANQSTNTQFPNYSEGDGLLTDAPDPEFETGGIKSPAGPSGVPVSAETTETTEPTGRESLRDRLRNRFGNIFGDSTTTPPGTPTATPTGTPEVPAVPEVRPYLEPGNVSPLVSEQITGLLAEDSPYMQAADLAGKQYAQQRGLLNTSLGAEASQKAAIEAAFPIASQDAAFSSDYMRQKSLQDDQLMVTIGTSDMPTEVKNTMLAYLDGTSGDGELFEASGIEAGDFSDYKEVQKEFGNFQAFVVDSDGRDFWKTDSDEESYKDILSQMGGKYVVTPSTSLFPGAAPFANTSGIKGAKNKQIGKAILKTFGSWDNAMRAARAWGGKNLSDAEATELIIALVKS